MKLHQPSLRQQAGHCVAIFGVGLVGSAISNSLGHFLEQSAHILPMYWANYERLTKQMVSAFAHIRLAVTGFKDEDHRSSCSQLHIVWAAGRAGFGASHEELAPEVASLTCMLHHLQELSADAPDCSIVIHLMSSLGGLFEGQRLINANSIPFPRQPYGEMKMVQEQLVLALPTSLRKRIYRLSSAVAPASGAQRMGLISRLVLNGVLGKTTTIVGADTTLRDYVWHQDIGRYVAQNIVQCDVSRNTLINVLASGKPSSIAEVLGVVETQLGRRLYIKRNPELSNGADITVDREALPKPWNPMDLVTSVSRVIKSTVSSM